MNYLRDAHGNVLTFENSNGVWGRYTRDAHGHELTFENSQGYWRRRTYDAHGRELSYEDSNGVWGRYTRDAHGDELSYEDSSGLWTTLAVTPAHTLRYQGNAVWAGCFTGVFNKALARWHPGRHDARAKAFRAALLAHVAKQTENSGHSA